MSVSPPIVCIMGPTASGKTDLALSLVPMLNAEIISVDSAMIYRGMDIGTAKPTAAEMRSVRHHLIDILDPAVSYSAQQFRIDALAAIADIMARGKTPVLVGGTMLYYQALQEGLSALPSADPVVRARLSHEAERIGWKAMHDKLALVDRVAANRIKSTDSQRIQRALEVFELTGKNITDWCAVESIDDKPYTYLNIALNPSNREELSQLIAKRFDQMLKKGLIEEAKRLYLRADLHQGMPSIRSVGYRQIWHYLDGHWNYAQMRDRAIIATRQLAKRQMTWLRSLSSVYWLDSADAKLLDSVLSLVCRFNIIQLEDNTWVTKKVTPQGE